jgi:hypothetical protein
MLPKLSPPSPQTRAVGLFPLPLRIQWPPPRPVPIPLRHVHASPLLPAHRVRALPPLRCIYASAPCALCRHPQPLHPRPLRAVSCPSPLSAAASTPPSPAHCVCAPPPCTCVRTPLPPPPPLLFYATAPCVCTRLCCPHFPSLAPNASRGGLFFVVNLCIYYCNNINTFKCKTKKLYCKH